MQILVINSGSSSIKFSIFEALAPQGGDAPTVTPRSLFEGALSDIGEAESTLTTQRDGRGRGEVGDEEGWDPRGGGGDCRGARGGFGQRLAGV